MRLKKSLMGTKIMIAIQTINLCKKYKDVEAVKDLNLTIEENSIYALLGLNGAGKTTTIKMITGLLKPTSGEIIVEGNSLSGNLNKVKEITSLSPQESAFASNLTVYQNIMMMGEIYGMKKDECKKLTLELIHDFSLEQYQNKRAKTLSGGYQRRLSIAMALVSKPKVLFLDEPTLGLDVISRRELWKLITSLKSKMTIVLTTHYMEEAEELASRIGIISSGKLIAEGNLAELLKLSNEDNLENAFIKLVGGKI